MSVMAQLRGFFRQLRVRPTPNQREAAVSRALRDGTRPSGSGEGSGANATAGSYEQAMKNPEGYGRSFE